MKIGSFKIKYFLMLGIIFLVCFFSFNKSVLAIKNGQPFSFNWSGGSIAGWDVPASGYYQLEVWGAQGGGALGGYGGYSTGVVRLEKGDRLFIVIGGQGGGVSNRNGGAAGYNGGGRGGNGYNAYYGGSGGGGATHIALESGVLSSFSNKKDKLLIVAGGGGGIVGGGKWNGGIRGGSGGGMKGGNGYGSNTPGTQTSGYSFGVGRPGRNGTYGSNGGEGNGGGGGGFYGGAASAATGENTNASAAGGSGYIGNPLLLSHGSVTKKMYCYSCSNSTNANTYTVSTTTYNASPTSNTPKYGQGAARITVQELTNVDARLKSITLSQGSWDKPFDPDTYEYDIVVGSENFKIDVDSSVMQDTSIISGNGSYDLKAGVNKINLIVTAEAGNTQTYVLNVTRKASDYKYLSDIKIDDNSIESFNPEKLEYSITVPTSTETLNLKAVYGRPSQDIYLPDSLALKTGDNNFEIIVVSEDGRYTTTYKLHVFREHSSLLKSITFGDGYSVNFNPETFEYTLNVMHHTMAVAVTAQAFDDEATIKYSGFGYIKGSSTATITVTEPNSETSVYKFNIVKENSLKEIEYGYNCSNNIQTFTVPATGYYRLEVWGAQGGSQIGGYGAYATGAIFLNKDEVLYIGVGCQGGSVSGVGGSAGGFNGGGRGGNGWNRYYGGSGGGGATHIATKTGTLASLEGDKDAVIIVAAGGSGSTGGYRWNPGFWGGHGGGIEGSVGVHSGTGWGTGGTQNAGYAFGQGANGRHGTNAGCGGEGNGGSGGGWYGGNNSMINGTNTNISGAGGSSYIASSRLMTYKEVTKSMYCYNCKTSNEESTYTLTTTKVSSAATTNYAKSGSGAVRITYLKQPSENNFLSVLNVKSTIGEGRGPKTYTPTFDMAEENYYLTLPKDETHIVISARPEDSLATIDGLGDYDIPSGTTDIPITVTAESGKEKVYTLHVTRDASDFAKPIDISISGLVPSLCSLSSEYCALNPTKFNPETHEYTLTVPSRIKQLYFTVEKGHLYQTVSGEGKVTLNGGDNVIKIEVASEDGKNHETYTYHVTRDMTGNTDLSVLDIIDPDRDINYDPDITEYYLSIPNEYTSIKEYDIKTDDENASYEVLGNKDFKTGMNTVTIHVTAANGEEKDYILHVYREKSGNALLSSLEVKNAKDEVYTLTPEFSMLFFGDYNLTVPNDIDSVIISAVPEVDLTSVIINNKTTGTSGGTQALNTGKNEINIITTAEDGSVETYILNITREKNSNNYLSSITVKNNDKVYGIEDFAKDTLDYEVTVLEGTDKITIEAIPEVSTTTYRLLDNDKIKVGNNLKRVMAISEDGSTRTYNINIIRPANTDNTLLSLKVVDNFNDERKLTPNFKSDVTSYTLEVENEVTSLIITPEKNNPYEVVQGGGTYYLNVGENVISIMVTSESGEKNEYLITVTRKANSDAYLKMIETSLGSINTASGELNYTLEVENDVKKITVKGIPNVQTTSVTSGNGEYNLKTGDNKITITTLAEDGTSSLTYNLTVKRKLSSNAKITSLIMEEAAIKPEFNPDTMDGYTAKVPMNVEKGTFHVTLADPTSTYSITGNSFAVGLNEVNIIVTAEDGTVATYKLYVTRQELTSNYLLDIKVDGTSLPDFAKEKLYYTMNVPYEKESVYVEATVEDADAVVTGTGHHNLNVGENIIVLEIESLDGLSRTYQIVINRERNYDARLASLEVDGSILTPNFNSDVYEYSLDTDSSYLNFTSLTTVDEEAYYLINNNWFEENGAHDVTIEVWAPDNVHTKTYTLHVNKTPSNNNNLDYLAVEGYEITPVFDSNTTLYYVTVPNDVNNVMVTAFASHPNATVAGDGVRDIAVGTNYISVDVTSETGIVKTYTIVLTKEGSGIDDLDNLIVHNGTMAPDFDSSTLRYNVTVPYEETSLDLTVVLKDDSASYSIVGNDLKEKETTVSVVVTAQNGNSKVYYLDVTKDDIISSLLKDLKAPGYELSPKFNSYVENYDLLVNYEIDDISKLHLEAIPLDKNATLEITSGKLNVGDNELTIKVTSSDGNSSSTYKVNVTRQAYANTFLDYLYTSEGDVTPSFNKETLNYTLEVENSVTSIEIFGESVDKSTKVNDRLMNGDNLIGTYDLTVGENKIPIVLESKTGIKRTYYVTITRKGNSDNYLYDFAVKIGGTVQTITPEYDKENTGVYELDVTKDINSINLLGRVADTSTVEGLGLQTLFAGENFFHILVTAENGEVRTYSLVVTKEASDNNYLTQLIPSSGTLEPDFGYYETEYTLHLDGSTNFLSFSVVTEDENATVFGHEAQLVPDGESTREITVLSESGLTRTYTIKVIKEKYDNAFLKDLYVEGYPFTESFSPEVYDYYISVPNSKQVLLQSEVVATLDDDRAKVVKEANLNLKTGENTYLVKVTAPNGFTTKEYRIHIERGKGVDSSLLSLVTNTGNLTSEFNPSVHEYTWLVPREKEVLLPSDVKATASDPKATITKSDKVDVADGAKYLVTVTSEDGSESTTYTLNIVWQASTIASLLKLEVSEGIMEPKFASKTLTYDVYEYVDTESIVVSATATSKYASIFGTGEVKLNDTLTTHEVTVLAEDGKTEMTYTLNIHKTIAKDMGLDDLYLQGLDKASCNSTNCQMTPKFTSREYEYSIDVPYDYDTLDLYVELMNNQQSYEILINNKKPTSMALPVGMSKVSVVVYDGLKNQTAIYNIAVYRSDYYDGRLASISVSEGYLEPSFDSNEYIYDVYEYVDTDEIEVFATVKDPTSVITEGTGRVQLEGDVTSHNITVTTASGDTVTYELNIHRSILKDTGLKDLGLNGLEALDCSNNKCNLNPNFKTDTTNYKITVPYEYTSLDLFYETFNDQQTVKFKVDGNVITGYELPVGKTNVIVSVYDGLGKNTQNYNLEIDRSKPNNYFLSSLHVFSADKSYEYTYEPAFQKDIFEYYMTVENDVDELFVQAELEDSKADLYINNYKYLQEGENVITVTVTAQDGTVKVYNINVNKLTDNNSYLKSLTLSTGNIWDLMPRFNGTKLFNYTTTVSGSFDKVTIEGVAYDTVNTEVSGNGEYPIKTGNNVFTINTENNHSGSISANTYTVNVIKLESRNVDLENLIVDEGNLSPAFASDKTKYTVHVASDVESATIHAIPKDRNASYIITGNNNLVSGENKVSVIVMSSDKSASKTYELTIIKAKNSDATLKELQVLKDDMPQKISPALTDNVFNYYVEVPHDTQKVNITATPKAITSYVTGTGEEYLNYGANVKNLVVTSEDGTENIYTITIYRNYNLDLMDIVSDIGSWDKEFNPNETSYTVNVPKDASEIVFIAFAQSSKVTVSGSGTYALEPGDNIIKFRATSLDGDYKEYTVNVVKEKDNNNYLKSLVAHEGGISPVFNKEESNYDVHVLDTIQSLTLDVETESPHATYEVIGNNNFVKGDTPNLVTIRVTAEDGSMRDYTLNVYLHDEAYFEAKLILLSISEGKLVPDFDASTYYYTASVDNSIQSLTITAVAGENMTVSGAGDKTLEVGRNIFPIIVTSNNGSVGTYTIVVYREANNDATLASLNIKDATLSPIFSKTTENYKTYVSGEVEDLEITAIPSDKNATVKITGHQGLIQGSNTVKIVVTASDGVTTKTYTIEAIKEVSTNNYLKSLSVSGFAFTSEFDKKNHGPYTVNVPASVNSIVIEAEAEVKSTTIVGDGAHDISKGNNVFTITATSESGEDRVYTIIVNKDLNSDNLLKDLLVSDGSLSPSFDPNTNSYTVSVPSELDEITVIGFAHNAKSTVTGSGTYPLTEKETTISVDVTSEDGTKNTYSVKVIKEVSEDSAKIRDLIVKNGQLLPSFNKNTLQYTVEVPYEVTSLDYLLTLEDENATYTVENNENFIVGNNTVKFIVTNNGNTEEYQVDVIRGKEASNYLTNLRVDGYTIKPYFDRETLYYTLTVPENVTSVDVIAKLEDASSTLTGDGTHSLEHGRNDIYVTVRSYSGVARTYTISITREENDDNKLLSLTSSVGSFDKEFKPDTHEYTLKVPLDTEEVELSGTISTGATSTGLGSVKVEASELTHNIIVTSSSGKINTYTITIKRALDDNTRLKSLTPSVGSFIYSNDILEYNFSVSDNDSAIYFAYELESDKATISGTDVKALEYGENKFNIMVTAEDGTTRVINFTVYRGKDLVAIIPEEDNLVLMVDEQKEIKYTLEPTDAENAEVEFVIEDEEIITIDENNVVKGLKNGSTTLMIRSKANPDIHATIVVNVIDKLIKSSVLDIQRDGEVPIVIGEEPEVKLSDFITKFDNDETYLAMYDSDGNKIEDLEQYVGSFMVIKLEINEVEYDYLTVVIRGDYNGDGKITAVDLAGINNLILGINPTDFLYTKIMDYNIDDKLTAVDLAAINNYVLRILDSLNKGSE